MNILIVYPIPRMTIYIFGFESVPLQLRLGFLNTTILRSPYSYGYFFIFFILWTPFNCVQPAPLRADISCNDLQTGRQITWARAIVLPITPTVIDAVNLYFNNRNNKFFPMPIDWQEWITTSTQVKVTTTMKRKRRRR